MKDQVTRKIIKEEVEKQIAKNMINRRIEYILSEGTLNEFDISDMLSSGLDFISSNIGQSSIDSFKQMIITEIFNYLKESGFPITSDSIFGTVLINVLQNLTAADMKDYFSSGGCEKIADRIMKGVQEGIQEDAIMNKIVEIFFGEGSKLDGIIGGPIRELINIKLKEMTTSLRDPLVDFACNHRDFDKLKSSLMSKKVNMSKDEFDQDKDSLLRFRK